MSYKKRDKGGWNQGKAYKGTRKAKEREYIRSDITQQIDEQDPNFRHKYKAKRKRNTKEHLRYQISWYERVVKTYAGRDSFWAYFRNSCRDTLKKLKKKWKEKYGKEKT